jgi:hypothetical protein
MSTMEYIDMMNDLENEAYRILEEEEEYERMEAEWEQEEAYEEPYEEPVESLKIKIPKDELQMQDDPQILLMVSYASLGVASETTTVNDATQIVRNVLQTIRPALGYALSLYNLEKMLTSVLCYEAAGNFADFWVGIQEAAQYAHDKYLDEEEYQDNYYDDYEEDYLEHKWDYDY